MKKFFSFLASVVGLIIVLGFAFWMDSGVDVLKIESLQTFSETIPWLVSANIANLVLAGLILTLLWFIYYKGYKSQTVGLIYFVVGFGLLFYPVIILPAANKLHLPLYIPLEPKTFTSFTSAIIVVVGLQRLFS